MKAGLFLAVIGLVVAYLDFRGYGRHADVWFRNGTAKIMFWDRWTDVVLDRVGSSYAMLIFGGCVVAATTVLGLMTDGPIKMFVQAVWGAAFGLTLLVFAIGVGITVFLFLARAICLALAWPRKGILTTLGLVLAVIGVIAELGS
jgi:hypothetical protein